MIGTIFSVIIFVSFLVMTTTITIANLQDITYNKILLKKIKELDKEIIRLEKELVKELEK